MDDEERAFRRAAAELVHALRNAAVAHDAAAVETGEDWLRILLEGCARDRRRLAMELAEVVDPCLLGRVTPAAPVSLADVLPAREQTLSTLGVRDAEVERRYRIALVHQPGRELGELLRRQCGTLARSRCRLVEMRRRDRVSSGR
jgi:hypothetical protein